MEELYLRVPISDMVLVSTFANRMGWIIEKRSDSISQFVAACRQNNPSVITDDDIMDEVRQVRYGK